MSLNHLESTCLLKTLFAILPHDFLNLGNESYFYLTGNNVAEANILEFMYEISTYWLWPPEPFSVPFGAPAQSDLFQSLSFHPNISLAGSGLPLQASPWASRKAQVTCFSHSSTGYCRTCASGSYSLFYDLFNHTFLSLRFLLRNTCSSFIHPQWLSHFLEMQLWKRNFDLHAMCCGRTMRCTKNYIIFLGKCLQSECASLNCYLIRCILSQRALDLKTLENLEDFSSFKII